MPDEHVETPEAEEALLKAELEEDGEVHDKDGKPLAWNHVKRVRQIYKEAKAGRDASRALRDLGVKPSDVSLVKAKLDKLAQYEEAEAEYNKRLAAGKTTDAEDEDADEDSKRKAKIRKQLEELGVRFKEEQDETEEAAREQQRIVATATSRVRETTIDGLEDAGIDLAKMDPADRADLLEEIDLRMGQKIKRSPEAREAILNGSMKPVKAFLKEILESSGRVQAKPDNANRSPFKPAPPRLGSSTTPGKASPKQPDGKPPKSVKDATEQMVAELAAKNRERRLAGDS